MRHCASQERSCGISSKSCTMITASTQNTALHNRDTSCPNLGRRRALSAHSYASTSKTSCVHTYMRTGSRNDDEGTKDETPGKPVDIVEVMDKWSEAARTRKQRGNMKRTNHSSTWLMNRSCTQEERKTLHEIRRTSADVRRQRRDPGQRQVREPWIVMRRTIHFGHYLQWQEMHKWSEARHWECARAHGQGDKISASCAVD